MWEASAASHAGGGIQRARLLDILKAPLSTRRSSAVRCCLHPIWRQSMLKTSTTSQLAYRTAPIDPIGGSLRRGFYFSWSWSPRRVLRRGRACHTFPLRIASVAFSLARRLGPARRRRESQHLLHACRDTHAAHVGGVHPARLRSATRGSSVSWCGALAKGATAGMQARTEVAVACEIYWQEVVRVRAGHIRCTR